MHGTRTNGAIAGAAALVLTLTSAPIAQAQCVVTGPDATLPQMKSWSAAVAGASASTAALIASINSVNTAFLTQSSAFIGSPPNPRPGQQGGGVWARGVGGHFDYATTTTTQNITLLGPLSDTIACNTRTMEDFAGVQIGTDVARLNVKGWNLHAGLTAGYLGSSTQDATPQGLNPPPSFRDSLQVPFVGVYGAASYGGFLLDGQVRGDFYENEIFDANHGLSGQHFNARSFSFTGNVAYNYYLGNKWFVEPSAGVVWSKTRVDRLNVPGTIVLGADAATGTPPWVLTVNDIDSILGRLSVRAGTTVRSGAMIWQPFASVGIFHEFQHGVESRLASNYPAVGMPVPTYSSTISTPGVGTYGQFGGGIAAQIVETGWVGYLRGDYRKGGSIEGWTMNGGVRYQFVPDPATRRRKPMFVKAAIYKAPAAAHAAYDWSGFYVGADLGAAGGFTDWNFPAGGAVNPRFAGFLAGGDVGYNYQVGKWVFGLEGSAGWTNARGDRPCPSSFFDTCEAGLDWLSTATVRVGYAWDRLLAYLKGGAVIADAQARVVCNTNSQPTIAAVRLTGCPARSDSNAKSGWTAGLGYEFGLTRNISAKGELMYFDLGNDTNSLGGVLTDLQSSGLVSTVGLRYRFGQ